jgi:hypothetical protein
MIFIHLLIWVGFGLIRYLPNTLDSKDNNVLRTFDSLGCYLFLKFLNLLIGINIKQYKGTQFFIHSLGF